IGEHLLDYVYIQLAVAAVLVSFYQLRNVAAERRFPRHHLVRTFLVIGLLGPAIYMIFPVVGPIFAYGSGGVAGGHRAVVDLWPDTQVIITAPHAIPFEGTVFRNCMPSLHTAWVTAIFIHSRKGPRLLRFFGTFWLVATFVAMLGFGYHYGADIIAGVVFALTIETALRSQVRGWDRRGMRLVAYGATVFTALLVSYRCLPVEMATYPWVFGPLLLLATASVIYGYVRVSAFPPPSRSSRPLSGPPDRSAACAGAPGTTGASPREG
ncbi:phosphatase PAP2 family protein, partial [Streptomyces sp. NPDC049555]